MKLFKDNNFKCIFENKRTSKNHRHKTINFSEYSIFDLIFKKINFLNLLDHKKFFF